MNIILERWFKSGHFYDVEPEELFDVSTNKLPKTQLI